MSSTGQSTNTDDHTRYEKQGIDKTVSGRAYVHLGIDTTGMHHHYLGDEQLVIVAERGYQRLDRHAPVRYRIRAPPAEIEYVQPDVAMAELEAGWCAFVARERGWQKRTHRVYDPGTAVWEVLEKQQ